MFAATRAGVMTAKGGGGSRYWRIEVTAQSGDDGWATLAEVQLRSLVGGGTVTTASTPVVSSLASNPLYPTSALVDGSIDTLWATAYPTYPYTLTFDMGVPTEIKEVAICPYQGAALRAPYSFVVKYSSDGVVFTTAKSFNASGWVDNTFKTFAL